MVRGVLTDKEAQYLKHDMTISRGKHTRRGESKTGDSGWEPASYGMSPGQVRVSKMSTN